MKLFWRSVAVLLAIWGAAAVVIWVSRSASPTPEKLKAYVGAHPLAGLDDAGRARILEKTAAQLNSLTFEQRRELRESGAVRGFFESLTPAERARFLDLTLPEGFRQMMSALNKMNPEKRQKLVRRVLDDIKKNAPQSAERINEDEVKKIVGQGVSSFYENANADVKLDFAPVLEELQETSKAEMTPRGFTIIELLVVMAIVAVLAALVVPAVGFGIARADSAKCLGNLRAIGVGLNAWLADNNMVMPPIAAGRKSRDENVPVIDTVLAAYLPDPRVFACPADKSQAAQTGTSYYWNSVLSGQSAVNLNFLSLATDLTKIPVIVDKEGWHIRSEDKVNHLFADGHAANHLRLFTDP